MQGQFPFLARLFGAAALLGPTLTSAAGESLSWGMIKGKIRREFPTVREITTAELAGWLADPTKPRPILLDVRTEPEFRVSHLERARHVAPQADPRTLQLAPRQADRHLLLGRLPLGRDGGEAPGGGLQRRAESRRVDLQWANEGRPLVATAGRTEKVHPYNRIWGLLLNRARHAEVPAAK
jgi:hypothetical protein